MRYIITIFAMALVAFAAFGTFVPDAAAEETVIVWAGTTGDSWTNNNKWEGGQQPTANDVAKVNNGTVPYVLDQTQGTCRRVVVENSGSGVRVVGELTLGDGGSRTSTLDDEALLQVDGELKIDGVQTFEGNGTIRLTSDLTALITSANNSADDLLVLTTQCQASPIERSCSITLAGWGRVRVAVDNQAFVVADYDDWDHRLYLDVFSKTTSAGAQAYWICENGGRLWINVPVTGSGHWWVRDVTCDDSPCHRKWVSCDGTIVVDSGCVKGTGDVILEAGCAEEINGDLIDHQLKVINNHFCTTGRLEWRSVEFPSPATGMSRPAILIEDYFRSARFGIDDLINCPACGD